MFPWPEATDESMLTDAELLALVARGEIGALSELHARYVRLVVSIALTPLNDPASAEDIVQQVFTKVWRHAQDYRAERGTFSTWVGAIPRHQCIDELRRRSVRPVPDPGDGEAIDRLAGTEDPAREAQAAWERARVRATLQRLPTSERMVIGSSQR
jgi:RNA polymerase sigma-70 factor (ECF subfamily)